MRPTERKANNQSDTSAHIPMNDRNGEQIMISPNEQVGELSSLIKETGKKVAEDSYDTFFEFLAKCGLSDADGPVPLEVWSGIAQAFADASGYRVGLEAEILEPIDGEPLAYRSIGKVEVASADPTIFVQPVGE